jgi:dolichol-phosphate mannosyltransferase
LGKLFNLAMRVIVGFSDKPLKMVMLSGVIVASVSFVAAVSLLLLHLLGTFTVEGWTSIMLSLWFLAGCMAFTLGLCGLYIGRILVETKGRPTYIIDEIVGSQDPFNRTAAKAMSVLRFANKNSFG